MQHDDEEEEEEQVYREPGNVDTPEKQLFETVKLEKDKERAMMEEQERVRREEREKEKEKGCGCVIISLPKSRCLAKSKIFGFIVEALISHSNVHVVSDNVWAGSNL